MLESLLELFEIVVYLNLIQLPINLSHLLALAVYFFYSVFKVHNEKRQLFIYIIICFRRIIHFWWAQEDSNLRPHAYQACALTA